MQQWVLDLIFKKTFNAITYTKRHQCRKTIILNSHKCLIYTDVGKMNNILIWIRILTNSLMFLGKAKAGELP
jgi:hypothetical protein